jgi:hypothetical protein
MCSGSESAISLLRQAFRQLREGARARGEDGGALTGLLRDAFTCRNEFDATLTALIGELDRLERERPDGEGERSVPGWLQREVHLTGQAAHSQVRLARQLSGLPLAAAAYERGEIGYQHAMTVARTVEQVEQGGAEQGDVRGAEMLMVEEARQRDPYDLLQWGKDLRHRLNPEELAAEERDQHQRRFLELQRRWDGMTRGEFLLDQEGAATLQTAMDAFLGPRRKDDGRTPGQRRADGLVGVARRLLDSGRLPSRGGEKPHLTVVANVETLLGRPGAPTALLNWLYPISREKLLHLCEDATATPVVVRDGNPLWVGRAQRTASKRMRKALAVRDRGCTTPGCDRPPGWTQAHHEQPWSEGGATDLPNLTSQCLRDHRDADAGYRTVRLPDGRLARVLPDDEQFGPAVHDQGGRGP